MKKLLWLYLLVGYACVGKAQMVQILDDKSGQPLEDVIVRSNTPPAFALTDSKGMVDISPFVGIGNIEVRLVGYTSVSISYNQLKKEGTFRLMPASVALEQVIVSSYTPDVQKNTSLQIVSIPAKEIRQMGAFNLTDALVKILGVDQLTTGIGISKPVIRGLYGHRILILFSGLRFDNQQWQDEHGLGLSNIGVERAEVIKGPLSMLYGTSANGGVINIIEEQRPTVGYSETDLGFELHSNTGGGMLTVGHKVNKGDHWYRLRAGIENHADYSDGNNTRVLNSRFNGYYFKGSYGFSKKRWRSENHYNFSYNNYGFIFSDISHFFEPDARWTRTMNGPHHIVMLNILSSVNTIRLRNSLLKLNVGVQSNYRAEDEGGDELSLIMHLLSGQYSLKWEKQLSRNLDLVLANNTTYEDNVNYGKRVIVPDARMAESNLSAYLKHRLGRTIVEYGLGGGFRYINALPTKGVNSEEKEMRPFEQTRTFTNGMLGLTYNPTQKWNLKANLATGVRAPNLAELSSNGLHEGIYTYEIGNPEMANEQNLNSELGIDFSGEVFQFGISAFYNQFHNYIYLQPTDEEWFGFPVYRFLQHDAAIYGGEANIGLTPPVVEGLKLSVGFSGLVGVLSNGTYLPFMPAQKLKPEIRYETKMAKKGGSFYMFANSSIVNAQQLENPEETETPGYTLVNAGLGCEILGSKLVYNLSLTANNLLNEAYYNHLSRLKPYGLLNIGRDISISLKINYLRKIQK